MAIKTRPNLITIPKYMYQQLTISKNSIQKSCTILSTKTCNKIFGNIKPSQSNKSLKLDKKSNPLKMIKYLTKLYH